MHSPECMVTLRLVGDHLDPVIVDRILGIRRTAGGRRGELQPEPNRSQVSWETGLWSYTPHPRSEIPLARQIDQLLDSVAPQWATVRGHLPTGTKADLFCGIFMTPQEMGGGSISPSTSVLSIPPEVLLRLGEFGIELLLDVSISTETEGDE